MVIMKIFKMSGENPDMDLIGEAIEIMAGGGVILYPTDTVYGLGANIFNNDAVRRVFEIKQRSFLKPLSVLVSDVRAMDLVAIIPNRQKEIIREYLPGPYTFILKKENIVPRVITSGSSYVGVRVPDNEISRRLASLFPITTTSANISDDEILSNPGEILEQLGCDVDLVIDVGDLKSNHASAIVDLSQPNPKIVRR